MTASPEGQPTSEEALLLLQTAIAQIDFARQYTLELLAGTPENLWFTTPAGAPTNIAWQIGHLTVSQYGLLMFRIRGRQPEDLELIPGKFRKTFGRGSQPTLQGDPPYSAKVLRERLQRVHQQAMQEIRSLRDPAVLLEPVEMPYAVYPMKLGAILFCPLHEQIHAGQIGLVRRLLNLDPVR